MHRENTMFCVCVGVFREISVDVSAPLSVFLLAVIAHISAASFATVVFTEAATLFFASKL